MEATLDVLSRSPWTAELRGSTGGSGEHTHFALVDPAGRVVCDTINSEVGLVALEADEHRSVYIDIQGKHNMEFIAMARSAFNGDVLALAWWEQHRKRIS